MQSGNRPTRLALDVPAIGTALGDAGDAYVASLQVELLVDGRILTTVAGPAFEAIVSAVRLRHLSFHPRTRALTPGSMKASGMAAAIDRHWSSIDSYGDEIEGVREIADTIATACRGAEAFAWNQAN